MSLRHLALLALCALAPSAVAAPAPITLAAHCPPGFALDAGKCLLRSPYRAYPSLQGAGVGGPKTGLPPVRDGFSPQQIDLGRYLFFDPLLSARRDLSCASCHDPRRGFADGEPTSPGADGKPLARNAPSLWNAAFLQRLFWDGRAATLEAQLQGPLYSADEMGSTPDTLVAALNASSDYRRLFAAAFADAAGGVRIDHVYAALAAFEASLVSLNSRYDLYAHGFHDALSKEEVAGMNVFRSFVARCAECHTPPLFTNQQIAVLGVPEPPGRPFDAGAGKVSGEPTLRGGFKVPSLRNVVRTAPYGHSGVFGNLREAVRFYTLGRGHAVPKGERLTLHWHIWEPRLSEQEIDQLVAFLGALTDESFMPERPVRVPSGLTPGGRGFTTKENP